MLKNHIQQFVDKRFYRERYNYREALRKLSLVLEQTHDREKMMDIVISNAEEMVHPRSVAIVLITDDDGAVVEKATPEALEQIILKPDSARALRESLTDGLKFIGLREIDEGVVKEAELVHTAFARLGADICLPLHVDKRFLGFIMLGMKRSESSYNLEDIELLRLLADQAAHGIVHIDLAVEAAEKEKLRRELEIGRRMQQSLLPLSPPKVAGLDVAAINLPAMEVGGDFFTFVEYNKGKLGVIAGDIVGKGVAGALRMAATISSLRLIAEESASVSESMQRLNRYLVKNSDERSFAAVLFTLVDISKREMRWCNGGFPDPVFIPIRGKIRYLENEEYPLPPGASANSAYVESSMKLKPGDTVVLVSDGVVEARPANQDDEQFGYERLLDFFEMNRKRSLEDMIEELKNTLYDYRGSSGFEDDVTVVAIRLNKSGKTS
jgi:sigma-B regulation protein RsbU (phosphoserine phosphatase)